VPKSDFGTSYLIYFTIMQSKKLYAWETGPVDDKALALLCAENAEFKAGPAYSSLISDVSFILAT
jgi:ATP-dependent RNA helicase DHX29